MKKEKPQPLAPELRPKLEEVLAFCKNIPNLPYGFEALEFAITSKFLQWEDDNWYDRSKDPQPIINWKSKMRNAITFMKPDWSKVKKEDTNSSDKHSVEKW